MKQQSINEVLAADKALIKAWDLLDKAHKREMIKSSTANATSNIEAGMENIAAARGSIEEVVQEPENSLG